MTTPSNKPKTLSIFYKDFQMKLFTLLNHTLTPTQKDQLQTMGITKIISISDKKWSAIPPYLETLDEFLKPYQQTLKAQAQKGDYLLVQGDFGATYQMVNYSKSLELIPIYATTKRISKETTLKNGIIQKQTLFTHCIFRKY